MTPRPELPDGALLTSGPGDLPQLRLTTKSCSAVISLYGGQVLGWTPIGTKPVLWLSPGALYQRGKAIRGGIPVCAPWFGPGIDGQHSPAHGWMRTATWQLAAVETLGSSCVTTLTLDGRDVDGGSDLQARLVVSAGSVLEVELTLTAGEPQLVEAALHTYLAVEDVRTVAVDGLQRVPYVERAGGSPRDGVDAEPVTFGAEVDRIYATAGPATVLDPGLKRQIHVAKRDSGTTVVWNPGPEKAATLSDLEPRDWQRFVCVETANAQAAAQQLEPGRSMTLATSISVEPLATS